MVFVGTHSFGSCKGERRIYVPANLYSFLTTSSFSCIISLDMFLISFRMFVVVTSFYQSFLSMSIFLGSFLNLRIILYLIGV